MIQRYFTEPYRFIPPHRGKWWCHVSRIYMPYHMRHGMGVRKLHFEGTEHLTESMAKGAGVMLCANHCRRVDPVVIGLMAAKKAKSYLYYIVSYHLFKQSKIVGWWINRIGGFSIWREGADREAIKASAQILANAERPLALFPEGTWFRQNDRLGPLQEGLSLMARQAARQTDRPLVLHPVGIKYWFLKDPRPELAHRLEQLERKLGWRPQTGVDLVARIEKLGNVLLATKEIEHWGHAKTGLIDDRIRELVRSWVGALEQNHLGREFEGHSLERIRRLRQSLARKLLEVGLETAQVEETRAALETLLFLENLGAHSMDYLRQRPSMERLAESVERIEETVSDDREKAVGPMGAVIRVGPAMDARALSMGRGDRQNADPMMKQLAGSMQALLDQMLEQGPPPEWGCPPRIEN